MISIRYRLTEFMFRHFVKPMMKNAATEPEKFFEKQLKRQQSVLPLKKLHRKYNFEEREANGTVYYAISPESSLANGVVLYFFGGGYFMPGNAGDFEFAQEMANETNADVWLVWYPLFPKASALEIVEAGVNVYREALRAFKPTDITFFGLSSGASLAQNICIHIVDKNLNLPMPDKLMLHSPAFRIPPTEKQKERMAQLDKLDCVVPVDYISENKAMDIVNFTGAEYMKSNVDFSWKGLPDIYVIFGSHEVLLAELDEAKQKAASENVVMRAYIGEGMMHTWAAAGFLPESRHVRSKIYSIIRQDSELKWENA